MFQWNGNKKYFQKSIKYVKKKTHLNVKYLFPLFDLRRHDIVRNFSLGLFSHAIKPNFSGHMKYLSPYFEAKSFSA